MEIEILDNCLRLDYMFIRFNNCKGEELEGGLGRGRNWTAMQVGKGLGHSGRNTEENIASQSRVPCGLLGKSVTSVTRVFAAVADPETTGSWGRMAAMLLL